MKEEYEWVVPVIVAAFVLTGTIVTVIFNARGAKAIAEASKGPDAVDSWAEAERARWRAHLWEDLYYLVRGAFKGYGRRMAEKFGDEEAALNIAERAALEAPVPEPINQKKE